MDSKDDTKYGDGLSPPTNEITVAHHDRAVWETRETYGPAGKTHLLLIRDDKEYLS